MNNQNATKKNFFMQKQPCLVLESTTKAIAAVLSATVSPNPDTVVAVRELARNLRAHASSCNSVKPVDSTELITCPCIVFVLGGPGSGKGTVCPLLVSEFGFVHLSVGDLLRSEVASKSDIGLQVESIMQSGGLVSDELALSIIKSAISKIVDKRGVSHAKLLLDGFPRTLQQAIEFEANIYPVSRILWLTCGEEVLTQRILERGRTSGRVDDNAESIVARLRTFNENTLKIKDYYDQSTQDGHTQVTQNEPSTQQHPTHSNTLHRSKMTIIDASLSVDHVYQQIRPYFVTLL